MATYNPGTHNKSWENINEDIQTLSNDVKGISKENQAHKEKFKMFEDFINRISTVVEEMLELTSKTIPTLFELEKNMKKSNWI